MRKNKWISLIVTVLLIASTFAVFSFGDGNLAAKVLDQDMSKVYASDGVADDELKLDMNFVGGSAGKAAEELKAEKEDEDSSDDFIITAIGNNLDPSTKETSVSDEMTDFDVTPETKPDDSADLGDIPYDIADPEGFESGEVEYADNQILIKFKRSFEGKVNQELKDAGIGKLEFMFSADNGDWYEAYLLKDADVNETMEKVRALDNVVVAEYNFKSEPASIDTDPLSDAVTDNEMAEQQWVLKSCGIQATWEALEEDGISAGGSSSVVVAVIDTGVDYTHKDLVHNIWVNVNEIPDNGIDDDSNGYVDDYFGADITAGSGSGMDDHGHGTHVAGIIAAENNDIGVVGIAYNTKIMPVKAGDASGIFLQSNIAKAIMYAYNEGAVVINMSFGGSAFSVAERDALATAYSRCVLVAAAGNNEADNELMPSYPADFKFVLGVMSSDKNDYESRFSNWDPIPFNNNEYEVYAPGNDILSTLPGDRYASLSGTSMASPVVAAQAALLRSKYNNMGTYPTKFIYGQIAGTCDKTVQCVRPLLHGHNNLPRVNFENSLKNMPKPEISVSDYTVFDTKGFSYDTEGIASEAAEVNNGDGIIDSGEVIALGFTLRNRWGMTEDSVVSINVTSELGVDNPYVTLLNNDLNYGSVGTYSEKDAGKITEDDKWTGWENPFYLKIADNCPNDYSVTVNITVESTNGLDETDEATYETKAKILLVIRNGVILPNKITEDMTLTADNYYIIPNSTIIMEDVTVTVEEGTKIQFWTNDPQDPYADTAIAYLKVNGELICKGTEEAPIEMFPSDWRGAYCVQIYYSDDGFISMEHTNISNSRVSVHRAVNCVFRQVYPNTVLKMRTLSNGAVINTNVIGAVSIKNALECIFYKLGAGNNNYATSVGGGIYKRCAFVDSSIQFDSSSSFTGCLFYGNNNNEEGSELWGASSYNASIDNYMMGENLNVDTVLYNSDWDKYYVSLDRGTGYTRTNWSTYLYRDLPIINCFAEYMKGSLTGIDSDEEYSYLNGSLPMNGEYEYWFGQHKGETGVALNLDETKIPGSVPVEKGGLYYGCFNQNGISFAKSDVMLKNRFLMEIPGNGLATSITLDKYVVNLEEGGTYQIEASIEPKTVELSDLTFTSEDESVATVDPNGIITAVGAGTTEIRVYSQDMAIYNYVTVNVTEHVALENLGVAEEEVQINIGETKKIKPVFTPSNTTETSVTYTSSDDTIAEVSPMGIITAKQVGDVTITLNGENGLTATLLAHVVIPAESINFTKDFYETYIEGTNDTVVTEPEILPSDATNKTLIWESTDPTVCTVTDGHLVKNSTGIVTLRATVQYTSLSDEITVIVTDEDINSVAVKTVKTDNNYTYAITEAGDVFVWGGGITLPRKMAYTNVEDAYFAGSNNKAYILDKDGNLSKYSWSITDPVKDESFGTLRNIKSLSSSGFMVDAYHAIAEDGSVYAWGNNSLGRLGDGSESWRNDPVQIEFDNEVVKILNLQTATVFLDAENDLYVSGGNLTKYKTPTLLESGIVDIYTLGSTDYFSAESNGGAIITYSTQKFEHGTNIVIHHPNEKASGGSAVYCYIEDGIPYVKGNNSYGRLGAGDNTYISDYTPMIGLSDIKEVSFIGWSTFAITNDGRVYGTGFNDRGALGIGTTENVSVPAGLEFFFNDYNAVQLEMTDWSGSSGTVTSDGSIDVTFNLAPKISNDYSMITLKDADGNNVNIRKSIDMNTLTIRPKSELTEGSTYTLTIPQNALATRFNGTMSQALSLSFEYQRSSSEPEPGTTEEIVHEMVKDDELFDEREIISTSSLAVLWEKFCGSNLNARFYSNVILNRLNDDDTSGWLRFTAPGSGTYQTFPLGYNYWGTTNEELIDKQILDFDDFQTLADIDSSGYLTEPPSDTFPFVTGAYLTVDGDKVDTVGNEEVTFVVDFNRAMDTSIPLEVRFGSDYPFADYTISGEYVSDTEWQGTVTLTTLIENGYQYFSISNGKAAGTSLMLFKDWGRFPFLINTSSAQSLMMQGTATEEGIELTWSQDDFETLAGYNVYRSTKEDGQYTKVNKTVIPADTKYLLDDTVEPGVLYYYNFTVVQSDMTESEPSGKVQITSLDTMAPNIYHTPVTVAYKGSNLVISATIIDNVEVQRATLYYRVAGTEEWMSGNMDKSNDKYSVIVNSSFITDDGLEYYIEAFDGREYTYKGTAEEPFFVMVQEAFSVTDLGDVDGNGTVELRDAMMLLMAVNDRLNLTEDEFRRADLDGNGELSAMEALKIISYINGTISSLI